MKKFFNFILNTLFPPQCSFCKKEGDFLCQECVRNFKTKKISQKYYDKPKEYEYLDGLIYGLDYEKNPAIQAALKQFKYKFTKELSDYFGSLMGEKLGELSMTKHKEISLVPVPLHSKRLRFRGFNQAQVLAESVCKKNNRSKIKILPALIRTRHTTQQAKLHKKERHENLKDAFLLNKNIVQEQKMCSKNSLIFIVDDVFTTGATMENCAKVLKEAGIDKVYGLVVARAFK